MGATVMIKTNPTAKALIREALGRVLLMGSPWIAVHELNLPGVSQCAASARLREMARANPPEVLGRPRLGTKVKEWSLLISD